MGCVIPPKIKICGLGDYGNIQDVVLLNPSYIGFIFHKPSSRNLLLKTIPEIPKGIKKTGVFVNETIDFINQKIEQFQLDAIQLHGTESPSFSKQFSGNVEVIKAFSVDQSFDFKQLENYQNVCDYFLFDTKGKNAGGNGVMFDWRLLEKYTLPKPYFLSGGIALNTIANIKELIERGQQNLYALDLNSRFEIQPGKKYISLLQTFISDLAETS